MKKRIPITSWSEADRPREKLLLKGRVALSDAELLAILIGSGNAEMSAVDLSKHILRSASDNLHELSRWEVEDLMQFKGIGEAKAITIIASLELGRRKLLSDPVNKKQVRSSIDIYNEMHPILADLNHEEFWIITLNNSLRILSKIKISQGGINKTVADSRIIMKKAINQLASGIILIHNHPSGNLKPSQADIALTNKLKEASKFFDIKLNDHLIVTQDSYYSFADEGLL